MKWLFVVTGLLSAGTAQWARAEPPPVPTSTAERIQLIRAMQECWTGKAKEESDTTRKGEGSIAGKVDGVFRKLLSVAGDAKVKVDLRTTTKSEFAPFTSSESNEALKIRVCYEAAFGEPMATVSPSPVRAPEPLKKSSPLADPPSASSATEARRGGGVGGPSITQTVEATGGHTKTGKVTAASVTAPVNQTIRASNGGTTEVGDVVATQDSK